MARLQSPLAQYAVITGNYWVFTLTDGALRMLIVLHFHALGYSAFSIALLFLLYELFGVITNLVGGWLGARFGLNKTMHIGLMLQVMALSMLLAPAAWLTVPWVMAAQALSGIAKDLNKMSAKSAIKQFAPSPAQDSSPSKSNALYRWVAVLTGSKNALKGVGFFLGTALLYWLGFQLTVLSMALALLATGLISRTLLQSNLGQTKQKTPFKAIFSKSPTINYLSAARFFLFGARDIWFVVALPVYLSHQMGWSHLWVGGFFAVWIMGYGAIQALTPHIVKSHHTAPGNDFRSPFALSQWALALSVITTLLAIFFSASVLILMGGLFAFGIVFAINSSMHSYLIVHYARNDGASLDVGFYYMANAAGRLIGTLLSGAVYQGYGLGACLWVATFFLLASAVCAALIPLYQRANAQK